MNIHVVHVHIVMLDHGLHLDNQKCPHLLITHNCFDQIPTALMSWQCQPEFAEIIMDFVFVSSEVCLNESKNLSRVQEKVYINNNHGVMKRSVLVSSGHLLGFYQPFSFPKVDVNRDLISCYTYNCIHFHK